MESPVRFLIVDDDKIHNTICSLAIRNFNPQAIVSSFSEPVNALEHLRSRYTDAPATDTIMLLDLNMPIMSGWEFLEEMNQLPAAIRALFDVYILTSSIDVQDRERARQDESISGFLVKPISPYQLDSMMQVRRIKSALKQQADKTSGGMMYHLNDDDRKLLDLMLPYFELNEIFQAQKCLRHLKTINSDLPPNLPVNLHADQIKAFLIANGFAYNFNGDALINTKGMSLALCGSLMEFQVQELKKKQ